jgi:hypothetical protein
MCEIVLTCSKENVDMNTVVAAASSRRTKNGSLMGGCAGTEQEARVDDSMCNWTDADPTTHRSTIPGAKSVATRLIVVRPEDGPVGLCRLSTCASAYSKKA